MLVLLTAQGYGASRVRPDSVGGRETGVSLLEVLDVAEAGLLGTDTTVGQPGDQPQQHADGEQAAGDPVLDPVLAVTRPGSGEIQAGGSTGEREPPGCPEAALDARVAAQHQAGDVH